MFINNVTKGNTFLKERLTNKPYCILAFTCKEYSLLAHNWFLHLKKIGLEDSVILVCLDKDSYSYARTNNIPAIYADQEEILNTIKVNPFANAWRVPHHICESQVISLITQAYNIDVISTDVDMIFTKKTFIEKIYQEIEKGFDTCIYTNADYNEITNGSYQTSISKNGGMIMLFTANFVKKLIDNVPKSSSFVIDAPDKSVTLKDIGDKFNIKASNLHPFLFTNTTFWTVQEMRTALANTAYAVHYNKLCDVTKLNSLKLEKLVDKKIDLMKQGGHWLVDSGG